MEVNEILKKVRKIEIKTKHISNELLMGDYSTAFKGRGMSFSEVREYNYGDDIRHIDWNVTARTNFPHIKVFEEEREMTMMFLIDCSLSAIWGTNGTLKSEYITELCAVLAFSAVGNDDKVGAVLFTDKIELYIPPAKGRKQILRIIREIINIDNPSQGTNISAALKYFHSIHKKKATCFLISDFIDQDYLSAMKIVKKKHDLICMHVYDNGEKELPDVGIIQTMDRETGKKMILDTSNPNVREAYRKRFEDKLEKLSLQCNQTKVDLVNLPTSTDYVVPLMELFKRRTR